MFRCEFKDASVFKRIVESVRELVQEANIDCSERGMSMQALDSSHVSLCHFFLPTSFFETFECTQPVSFGVHFGNVSKILKCAGLSDALALSADENSDVLHFAFSGNGRKTAFELKLMAIDCETLEIPEMSHDCIAVLPGSEFSRVVKEMYGIGDVCRIKCDDDALTFEVEGDIGIGSVSFAHGQNNVGILAKAPVSLPYAMKYLAFFAKGAALCDTVKLRMMADAPIVVEFAFGDGALKYYLAPKLDDDDECEDV